MNYFDIWHNSGKEDVDLPENKDFGSCDVGISADVIEHIREPNGLLKFMRQLNCHFYVISTPKRELMNR